MNYDLNNSINSIIQRKYKQSQQNINIDIKKMLLTQSKNISTNLLNRKNNFPYKNNKRVQQPSVQFQKIQIISQNPENGKIIYLKQQSKHSINSQELMIENSRQVIPQNNKIPISTQTSFAKERYKTRSIEKSKLLFKDQDYQQKMCNKQQKYSKTLTNFLFTLDLPDDFSHNAKIKLKRAKEKHIQNITHQKIVFKQSKKTYRQPKTQSQREKITQLIQLRLDSENRLNKTIALQRRLHSNKESFRLRKKKKINQSKLNLKLGNFEKKKIIAIISPDINQAKLHPKIRVQKFNLDKKMRLTNSIQGWNNKRQRTQEINTQKQLCPWKNNQFQEHDF